jgi:protein-L-isoaspartate O-methyltransferase
LRGTASGGANGISRAGQTYFKTDPMARHAARPLLTKLTSVVAIFCGSGFPAAIIEAERLSHKKI